MFSTMSNISLMSILIPTLAIYTLNVNAALNESDSNTLNALNPVFEKWDNNMKANGKNNLRKNAEKMTEALNRCKEEGEQKGMSTAIECLRTFLSDGSLRSDLFSAPLQGGQSVQSDIDTFISENQGRINTGLETLLNEFKSANVLYVSHKDD